MAVEIPVVIDIAGGIDDAIHNQLPKAISSLQSYVDKNPVEAKITIGNIENADKDLKKLNDWYRKLEQADWGRIGERLDLTPQINQSIMELRQLESELNEIQQLRQMEGGQGDFSFAEEYKRLNERVVAVTNSIKALQSTQAQMDSARPGSSFQEYINSLTTANSELLKMREYYSSLEDYSIKYASSINAIRDRIADLNAQWNAMTKAERQGAEGRAVYDQYKKETKELREEALALEEVLRKEQRRQELSQRYAQRKRYENAVMKESVNTIKGLQEQERILTERLNKSQIGSDKYKQLEAQLEKVRKKLQEVTGSVNTTTGAINKQSMALRSLASYASMYFSVFGLVRFAKQVRDVTGELEYQRVALGHLIQDQEYGAKLFERIKEAALESPFQIKDLVTYTKQLAAYRIEQENLFDTTKRLADISAGLGVDMNRLILAFGQVRAASVLRGQELRQFTEAGIPLVELLADKMGELHNTTYRTADVFKLISERAVPFSAISEIFEELTEKGGMFYKMQEEQAKTLKGRWEKLKDAFSVGLQAAGETQTFIWQNNLLLNTLTLLAKNVRFVPKLIEAMGFAWLAYTIATMKSRAATRAARIEQIKLTAEDAKTIAALKLKKNAEDRLTRAIIMHRAATNGVSRAWWKLNAAMIANPIGAIIAGVTALISLFTLWRKKTDEQADSFGDLTEAIENVSKSEKQYEKLKKQINVYERLAANTERTAKENVQLANTLSVLREAFPSVTLAINDTNESLAGTVAELRKLNDDARKAGLAKAVKELEMAQGKAEELKGTLSFKTREQNAAWQTYQVAKKAYGEQSKQAKKARDEYYALGEQIDETNKKYVQVLKYIEALDKYINPQNKDTGLAQWQKVMKSMKDFKVDGKSYNLIGEGDIEGYESLYKGLQKIDKIYQDATNSAKEMKAGLSAVSEEFRETAEEEIRVEEGRRDAAKAILDTFGYVSKIDKKKDTSSLAILKEELKNVQEIYKRYKEFLKYMSQADAAKKIKEIYSGVTAIDFLSPETYKKRLSDLLSELRKMQGRVKVGVKNLSAEMADDLKKMLRKNESFSSTAYQLEGEKGYTIGYGFYDKLVDGTKVVEGMTMTVEEAEAELEKQVQRTAKITNQLLAEYGNGIQLTERQFNILADLAYQGPGVLKRALKEANGDAEKLAEALKDAAWPYVAKKMQAGVKSRDLKRSLLFQMAGATTEEEAKEIASTIQNLERIVQDVDWDELKESIEYRIKTLSDEIKKSQAAKDFFKNIFEATGDQDIAASMTMSVYGDLGSDLEKKLREQLSAAFVLDDKKLKDAGLSVAQANADVAEAILKNDYNMLGDYLQYVTDANKANADKLLEDRIKNNAEWYKDFVKTYAKARSYQERVDTLNKQREREKEEAKKRGVDEAGLKSIDTYFDRKVADVKLEALKDTYTWTKTFEDLEGVSSRTLKNLIILLDEYIEKSKESASPEALKTVMQAREQAQEQLVSRDAYSQAFSSLKKYISAKKKANELDKKGYRNSKEWIQALDEERDALKDLDKAFGAIGDSFNTISSIVSSISEIANFDELSDGAAVLSGIAEGISLVGTALVFVNAMLTIIESNPIVAAISAIVAAIAAVYKVVSNITANKKEREIKKQQKLIDALEESYDRLAKAMEKSFGSDYIYNYNQQLEVLAAKQKAYEEQARLESEKGKKADEEKIKDYQDAAKKAEEQIADMKGQLAEFFSGTDLTSAAQDFASAWIEAYKEFGSVTDAMSEKFQEMVESMINKSLAAKIMQEMLEPVFNQIDTMAKDGLLSTQDIADIAAIAQERIPMINEAMTGLMSSLASAGYDVRESTSGFKGISKDYATASEESILGLAAAVNTQNFYISYVPTISEDVSSILAAMTGGENPMAPVATDENGDVIPSVQMMIWKNLPEMHDDLAAIKRMLSSVITGKTTNTNTAYIAVK